MEGLFLANSLMTLWFPAVVILLLSTVVGYPLLLADNKVYLGPVDGIAP